MGKLILVSVACLIVMFLFAEAITPSVGDVVTSKQQIQLTDGDQETCVLPKGEKVLIDRVDYRSYGSTMTQKIYMVKSIEYPTCWGFALADFFR